MRMPLAILPLLFATPALAQQAEQLPPLCFIPPKPVDGQRVQGSGSISVYEGYISFTDHRGCTLPARLPLADPGVLKNAIYTARGYTRWIDEPPAPGKPKGYWRFEIDTISDITFLPDR